MPYYSKAELKEQKSEIIQGLKHIIESGNINSLSFPYYLYDFIKNASLRYFDNIEWLDIPLLTWNEGHNGYENMQSKAFFDPQIKVILVGEKGNYR